MSTELTRETLDREAIDNEGRVVFGCSTHPGLPLTTIYQDGAVRVLCPACGFEVARVKVAYEQSHPALSQEQRERLRNIAGLLEERAGISRYQGEAEGFRADAAFLRDLAAGGGER